MTASLSRRQKKLFISIAAAAGFYSLAGFVLIPAGVKYALEGPVSEKLGRSVLVGHLSFNPFTFELTTTSLQLDAKNSKEAPITVERAYADFEPALSLVKFKVHFREIALTGVSAAFARHADGTHSFSDLMAEDASETAKDIKAEKNRSAIWSVGRLRLRDSQFAFADQSAGDTKFNAENISLDAENLTLDVGEQTNLKLSGTVPGGKISASGAMDLACLKGELKTQIKNVDTAPLRGYGKSLGMDWSGRVTAEATIAIDVTGNQYRVESTAPLSISRAHWAISGASPLLIEADALSVNTLTVSAADKVDFILSHPAAQGARLSQGQDAAVLSAGSITLTEAKGLWSSATNTLTSAFTGTRVKDFSVTLPPQSLSTTLLSAAAPELSFTYTGKGLTVQCPDADAGHIDVRQGDALHVALEKAAVKALDLTLADTLTLKAESAAVSRPAFSMPGNFLVKLQSEALTLTGAELTSSDALRVTGQALSLSNLSGALSEYGLTLSDATVQKAEFSLSQNLRIAAATAGVSALGVTAPVQKGKVSAQTQSIAATGLTWTDGKKGAFTLTDLSTRDTALSVSGSKLQFGKVAAVSVKKVTAPKEGLIRIAAITVDKPRYSVTREEDGEIDVTKLLGDTRQTAREALAETAQRIKTKSDITPHPVRIGSVQIREGALTFSDRSVKPAGIYRFTGMNTKITPLVVGGKNEASTLTAEALVNGVSRISLTGNGAPLAKKGKLTAKGSLTRVSLPFFTPYAVHYTGYPVQKGNLKVDADIEVTDKTYLKVANSVLIEDLVWGDHIPVPSATTLPVTLATSLLRDSAGNISFSIPVSGDVADPSFSIGGIVWTAVTNLIVKAVTAPVNLVGSLVGLFTPNAKDTSVLIPFLSASAQTDSAQDDAVRAIVQGLVQNPKAKLEITPVVSPAFDGAALQQKIFDFRLSGALAALPEKNRTRLAAMQSLYESTADRSAASLSESELTAALYAESKATPEAMMQLANARVKAFSEKLTAQGITANRLFITAPEPPKKGGAAGVGGVRVRIRK